MKSDRPKVAFEVCGWPLVRHVVEAARTVPAERIVVVVGHGREHVERALAGVPGVELATQREQRGTADAVKAGLRPLRGFDGTVLVLCGDVPLVQAATLQDLLARHRRRKAAASVLSVTLADAGAYGRVLRDAHGGFVAIREARDCSAEERAVREINTGLCAFESEPLRAALRAVRANNSQGEYYLTDVPAILLRRGERVQAVDATARDGGAAGDVLGVNTLAELADAGRRMRWRILEELMAAGVEISDPATTFVDRAARIGRGTRVLPCTVIERDVVVGERCEVGPFSHLRPGTVLADRAEIGNFVETKNAVVGAGAKAKHLTYLGDAEIGARTNVGCGTITANYDGKSKHRTVVEEDVHIGSGTVLVAPVRVGRGATTGAGAIVTAGRDVAPGDVVVGVPARSLRGAGARDTAAGQAGTVQKTRRAARRRQGGKR